MKEENKLPDEWECQEAETPKAYEAFCVYRDMGPSRSIVKAGQKLGKNKITLEKWSSQYSWVKRAAAWDLEQDRISRESQIKEIQQMRQRHTQLAMKMLDEAEHMLALISDKDIKAADVSRMVETASKLERISRGDVESVIEERQGENMPSVVTFYMPDNKRQEDGEKHDA